MTSRRSTATLAAFFLAVSLASVQPAAAYRRPFTDVRLDLSSEGIASDEADPNQGGSSSISASGRFIAFDHLGNDLVPGDKNLRSDVFVRDVAKGTLESISTGVGGVPAIGPPSIFDPPGVPTFSYARRPYSWTSFDPSMSADGRYVAFSSAAINLVIGDTNLAADVFVNDRKAGRTERVSVGPAGEEARGISGSYFPSISADGRYVSFSSDASNLVPGDENNAWDVFVHDLRLTQTSRVSVNSEGNESNSPACKSSPAPCPRPTSSISSSGRYVVFDSDAPDLVEGDTNLQGDVFVHDRKTRATERVSVSSTGEQASPVIPQRRCGKAGSGLNGYGAENPVGDAISADGRYVTFASAAKNLVPNDTNDMSSYQFPCTDNGTDIFTHDRRTGRTERVSVEPYGGDSGGLPGSAFSSPTISGNGRYIAFHTVGAANGSVYFGVPPYERTFVAWFDRRTGSVWTGFLPEDFEEWGHREDFPDLTFDGRYLSGQGPYPVPPFYTGQAFFRRDLGTELGVGDVFLIGDGLRVEGESGAIAQLDDSRSDATGIEDGAEIIEATFAYRPRYSDLYVKIDLDSMPGPRGGIGGAFAAGNPALVYGARFTVDGSPYEVRASKTGSLSSLVGPAFGLFRCAGDLCEEVAPLHGGYGTVGESIVVAVPLEVLGLGEIDAIENLEAFSALGTYVAGPIKTLDLVASRD